MRRLPIVVTCLLIVVWLFLSGCTGSQGPPGPLGPAGPAGPVGPPGPAGENASASQTYIGSEACGDCHEDIYATYSLSGHPHALTPIENNLPPVLPYADVSGGLAGPPEGYTWDDIAYVISGFGWKGLFVGKDGYVLTGDESAATQYNFANEIVEAPAEWVPYHPGEQIPFDCGICHTTGYAPQGHQDNLEGIDGTWALPGIQCERCHGPGSLHAADPQGIRMVVERASQLCGDCHTRDNPAMLEASEGFAVHQIQFDDLYNSRHFALDCIDCHDPHASAVFADEELNPKRSIRQVCEACHWQNEAVQNNRKHEGVGVDCIDCHMPPMAKSAQADLDLHIADIRSHQFSINTDPEAPQFSEDGLFVMPYLTLTYACGHCHNGRDASEKDGETLADIAAGYHTKQIPTSEPSPLPEVETETAVTPTPES